MKLTLNFSSPEQTATLRLSHKYDLTTVSLVAQVKESALAARAKAKKDADDKFMADAEATAKQMIAADEVRRAAQAANLSDAPLHALADSKTPVPLPEGAENVEFDGADGKLEFDSASSVKALAAFYRESHEVAGLEGTAFGDQQIQHGGDGILQGRQRAVVHRHADGTQGERERRWFRAL